MAAHSQPQAPKAAAPPKAADAPEVLRDVSEKAAAQTKENFEKVSSVADAATEQMKNTGSVALKGAQECSSKLLEFAHVNIEAAFEHARKLSSVKSPAEFFALSNDHLRRQFEVLSRQAQELAAIAQKMAAVATESVKAGVHRA
jgi:phasin